MLLLQQQLLLLSILKASSSTPSALARLVAFIFTYGFDVPHLYILSAPACLAHCALRHLRLSNFCLVIQFNFIKSQVRFALCARLIYDANYASNGVQIRCCCTLAVLSDAPRPRCVCRFRVIY